MAAGRIAAVDSGKASRRAAEAWKDRQARRPRGTFRTHVDIRPEGELQPSTLRVLVEYPLRGLARAALNESGGRDAPGATLLATVKTAGATWCRMDMETVTCVGKLSGLPAPKGLLRLAVVAGLVLLVARSTSVAPDAGGSGDPDRDFVAMMIPHHRAAVEMAIAELRFGRDETLRRMAQGIIVEQGQEIVAMRLAASKLPSPSRPFPSLADICSPSRSAQVDEAVSAIGITP